MKVIRERILNAVHKCLEWKDGEITGIDMMKLEQRIDGILKPNEQLHAIMQAEGSDGCEHHFVYARDIKLKDGFLCTECGYYKAASEGAAVGSSADGQSGSGGHVHQWEHMGNGVYQCYYCHAFQDE